MLGPAQCITYQGAGVRGHVWFCAWLSRTDTNKETFESAGGFHVHSKKTKESSWLRNRITRTASLHAALNASLIYTQHIFSYLFHI